MLPEMSACRNETHTLREPAARRRDAVTQTTDPIVIIAALDLIPLRPTAAGGPLVVRRRRAEM